MNALIPSCRGAAVLALTLLFTGSSDMNAQQPSAGGCDPYVASDFAAAGGVARDSFAALVDREPAPGASVAVVVDGELAWSEALGLCRHTRFRLGSVSKVVTALALLRLNDAGLVDLDADVRTLVDAVAHHPHPISLRLLVGHLGGIRHYASGAEYMNTRRYESVGDALGIFSADPLIAPPGTEFRYSSYGYNLLGAALEPFAGSTYAEAVTRWVLEPLGLESTSPEAEVPPGELAAPHSLRDGSLHPSPAFDPSDRLPSGGWAGSAEDAARLGYALIEPGFLSVAARALVRESQRTAAGDPTEYSMGMRLEVDAAGRPILHHGGTSVGARAFLLVYPEHGVAIALLANGPAEFAEAEVGRIAEAFLVE